MKIHFENRTKYICQTCGKELKRADSLKQHETLHLMEPLPKCKKCQFCKYTTDSDVNLAEHNLNNHKDLIAGEVCKHCFKSFKSKDKLKRHIKMHLDVRKKCPICQKSFRELKKHLFQVHKQSFKCPDCNKEMSTAIGVELHRHRVHGKPKPSQIEQKEH